MGLRRKPKGRNKARVSMYAPNNIYVCNVSLSQAFELFDNIDSLESKYILTSLVIIGVAIHMMAQISISSRPEKAEWTDQLQSYKDIKIKVINGKHGRIVVSCIGFSIAFPYAMEEFEKDETNMQINMITFVKEAAETSDSNIKRVKASKDNWPTFMRGEMGAAKGQLLSCPSTNIIKLGIDGAEVSSYGVEEAIEKTGFDKKLLEDYGITTEYIIARIRDIFLTDNGGLPIEKLVYNEPRFVRSKIQNEILGDNLIRTDEVSAKLEKGMEPISAINIATVKKYLSKTELFAYNIAVRTGDSKIIKRLTDIVLERANKA